MRSQYFLDSIWLTRRMVILNTTAWTVDGSGLEMIVVPRTWSEWNLIEGGMGDTLEHYDHVCRFANNTLNLGVYLIPASHVASWDHLSLDKS